MKDRSLALIAAKGENLIFSRDREILHSAVLLIMVRG